MNNKLDRFGIAVFLTLTVCPLTLAVGYALLYGFGLAGILDAGFTTSHWHKALTSIEVWGSLGYSIYIASAAMMLSVPAGLLLALLLRQPARHGRLSTVFYFPLALPPIVAAFITFHSLSGSGLLSRLSFRLHLTAGIDAFPNLVHDRFGIGIIFTHAVMAVPFLAILFANLFESENIAELQRVARSLGGSWSQIEWRISLPLLLQRAFPTIVLYWIYVLGSYEVPLILGRQSPLMISVLTILKLQRFNLMDIPLAFVIAVIYLAVAGALIFLLVRNKRLAFDV